MKDDFYTLVKIITGTAPDLFEYDLNHALIQLAQDVRIISVTIQEGGRETYEYSAAIVYQTATLPEEWSDFS